MPKPDFFARLGLVVVEQFLDVDLCQTLIKEARSSVRAASLTYKEGKTSVDENFRKANDARVSMESRQLVHDLLLEIKPKLEEHFGVSLSGCQKPDFLTYKEGDFFELHRDNGEPHDPSCPESLRRRKVSVVIFLNRQVEEYEPTGYSGGSLSFYGLIDRPEWKEYGFPLAGEPGLLVAFRSDTYHRVGPVTHGERHTIATWFI